MSSIRPAILAFLVAGALPSFVGCAGTETGNPPFAPMVASESGVPMGVAPTLDVDQAWLAVSNVSLEPGASCAATGDGVVFRHEPAALDLSNDQTLDTEPVLEEGDYCAFSFDRVVWAAADPAALTGLTLAIDATLMDGTAVHIRSTRGATIRLVGAAFPMTPDAGGLVLFVDESLLFNGLSFTGATRETDGSIVVDETTNRTLLDRVEAQLAGSLFLYRDVDGDGRLSTAERGAGPLAAP